MVIAISGFHYTAGKGHRQLSERVAYLIDRHLPIEKILNKVTRPVFVWETE